MQKSPHLLIEGMIIAAYAAGINRAFIYIRGEYAQQADILDAAVAEAERAGYLGERILGSDLDLSLVVHRGAGAYICGEETALLDSLEGKRGNPRLKPPFPANQGLYQGPTLINNVETLATVPTIIEMGGEEYAKIGTENSTGTKLVSVSGNVQRPGNYEIELGMSSPRDHLRPRRRAAARAARSSSGSPAARRRRSCCPSDLDLPYDFDSMAKAGSMLGSGAIIVIDDSHVRRRRRAVDGEVLPPRVVRQVLAVPRGHELDREDARAHQVRRGHADGPRHHGLGLRRTSSATACACSATRWRCRSARWSRSSGPSSRRTSRRRGGATTSVDGAPLDPPLQVLQGAH